jgi:F0F1-type ATP synthase membrane subunit a
VQTLAINSKKESVKRSSGLVSMCVSVCMHVYGVAREGKRGYLGKEVYTTFSTVTLQTLQTLLSLIILTLPRMK